MGIHQIDKIASYIRYLQENTQELDLLFKELLIGVTSFFRDSAPWEQLRESVIPALLANRTSRPRIAGVGARLLHRGGSVFPGHGVQGGNGSGQAAEDI
jgi:chemotaxis methyl-accepting protein methylase